MSTTRLILIVVGVIILLLAIVFSFFRKGDDTAGTTIAFSEVLEAGRDGRLETVHVDGRNLDVKLRDDEALYESVVGHDTDVASVFVESNIVLGEPEGTILEFENDSAAGQWINLAIAFLPSVIFVVVLYFAVYWAVRRAMRERSA